MITTAGLQQTYSILDISPAVLTTIKYRAILTANFLRRYFGCCFSTLFFTHMDIIASNSLAAPRVHLNRVKLSGMIRKNFGLGKIPAA